MRVPPRSQGSLIVRAGKSYLAREVLLPVQAFIYTEGVSSIVLFAATVTALVWANSPWQDAYFALWKSKISLQLGDFALSDTLGHWINDGLMAVFFFVVGLEVKRELLHGELSDRRRAALPVLAGLGGMLVPALIYLAFNTEGLGQRGWGIPMATDIAFALGALTLLGKRVPIELRVFLLALAIVDDIGAILVIAVFYTDHLSLGALGAALALLGVLLAMNRLGIYQKRAYVGAGVLLWLAVYASGLHPTLAGVLAAAFIPASPSFSPNTYLGSLTPLLARFRRAVGDGNRHQQEAMLGQIEELSKGTEAPLERLERTSHGLASTVVLPVFALANAGVAWSAEALGGVFSQPVPLGILTGLLVGKPLGILGFSWLAVRLKLAALPHGVRWSQVAGVGLLAGIGFTVSLFITGLSFADDALIEQAKMGILLASLAAGALGVAFLLAFGRRGGAAG